MLGLGTYNYSCCHQARASPPGLRYRLQLALLGGHLLGRGHGHAGLEHMPVALQVVQDQQPRPRRNAHFLESTAQTPSLSLHVPMHRLYVHTALGISVPKLHVPSTQLGGATCQ